MRKIVFQGDGFGDFFVCFKALYALKQLYPNDKIIAYHSGMPLDFVGKLGFVDEVVDSSNVTLEQLRQINPDIFIATARSSKFFKQLQALQFKKVIVQPHFISVTRPYFTTPIPYFRGKMHTAHIHLKLVRSINKKYYDSNIATIDFSKIKDFLPKDDSLVEPFLQSIPFPYTKIVGINAFSNYSEHTGTNLFTKDWIKLAFELARAYPQFLFVLLNFQSNPLQFHISKPPHNLKVFINNANIASLVSISLALDYFITIDTGNLHLCDILRIPTLGLTRPITAYRMGGGATVERMRDSS